MLLLVTSRGGVNPPSPACGACLNPLALKSLRQSGALALCCSRPSCRRTRSRSLRQPGMQNPTLQLPAAWQYTGCSPGSTPAAPWQYTGCTPCIPGGTLHPWQQGCSAGCPTHFFCCDCIVRPECGTLATSETPHSPPFSLSYSHYAIAYVVAGELAVTRGLQGDCPSLGKGSAPSPHKHRQTPTLQLTSTCYVATPPTSTP